MKPTHTHAGTGLLTIYAKSVQDTIPGHLLKAIKEAMGNDENE